MLCLNLERLSCEVRLERLLLLRERVGLRERGRVRLCFLGCVCDVGEGL